MKYKVQHTGRGKLHLIDEEFEPLCGSKGDFIFSTVDSLSFDGEKVFLHSAIWEDQSKLSIDNPFQYCKKCIKKMKVLSTHNPNKPPV